jgi:hypothetical protein
MSQTSLIFVCIVFVSFGVLFYLFCILVGKSRSLTYFRPDYEELKPVISSWFDPGTVQIRWLKSWKDFYNGQIISGRRYGVPVTLELKTQFGGYSVFNTETHGTLLLSTLSSPRCASTLKAVSSGQSRPINRILNRLCRLMHAREHRFLRPWKEGSCRFRGTDNFRKPCL